MYTEFHVYFENIQYYFTEFNMVQKLKYTNKIDLCDILHFIIWSYLHIFICIPNKDIYLTRVINVIRKTCIAYNIFIYIHLHTWHLFTI